MITAQPRAPHMPIALGARPAGVCTALSGAATTPHSENRSAAHPRHPRLPIPLFPSGSVSPGRREQAMNELCQTHGKKTTCGAPAAETDPIHPRLHPTPTSIRIPTPDQRCPAGDARAGTPRSRCRCRRGGPAGTHRRRRRGSPAGTARWRGAGARSCGRSSRTPCPCPSRGGRAPRPAAAWRPWPAAGAGALRGRTRVSRPGRAPPAPPGHISRAGGPRGRSPRPPPRAAAPWDL